MTESPTQSEEQPRTGLATENLRSYERLRRSVTDRKIAGVAGGLGRHLNIDPTVLRVLFVVLVFFGGAGLLIYAAAWLLVPEEGTERSVVRTTPSTRNTLLIVVGVLAALLLIGDTVGGVGFPWPLALVALVVAVVLLNRDSARGGTTPATTQATPTPPAVPYGPWTLDDPPPPAPPSPPSAVPDRGPTLFGPTVALVLLALGALGLYDISFDVVAAAYPAVALAVIGTMLVVGSVVGRPGGLILLGVLAALALGLSSVPDQSWTSETRLGRTPATAADVRDEYRITAGQVRLDLTEVADPENLDGRRLRMRAEAGELLVLVPDGVDVDVDASIAFGGEIEVDGVTRSGNDIDLDRRIDGGDDVPQIHLELDLLVGHIEVQQEEAA